MLKFYICYCLYQVFKYFPCSCSRTLTKGKVRSFFGKRIMKSYGYNVNIEHGATFSKKTVIGNNSGIGVNCKLQGEVIIGDNVMMGQDVLIFTSNHSFERTDIPMEEQGYQREKPVVIGNDVWIGARVIVLPGVTIGDGCIIGAGSVVTKDAPPYTIIGGNPARVLKER